MKGFFSSVRAHNFTKVLSSALVVIFSTSMVITPATVHAQAVVGLPQVGSMVVPSESFMPVSLKALQVRANEPLVFDFIVDNGNTSLQGEALKKEIEKLTKYFLATITIPEKDLWVNLSPYEKNRIIADELGLTEMGRDLLAQDYVLKQLSASLVHPDSNMGQDFWRDLYATAQKELGTTEIPMDTFNKVWIAPDKATVYEVNNTAVLGATHLKVMMEEDYLALREGGKETVNDTNVEHSAVNKLSSDVMRRLVLPAIEKEVNEGKNFAVLRQMYGAMILATWYKEALKDSLLAQVYADQKKVPGVDVADKNVREKIFAQYVQSYKAGVFKMIREEADPATGEVIPRKYFSGGYAGEKTRETVARDKVKLPSLAQIPSAAVSANNLTEATIALTAVTSGSGKVVAARKSGTKDNAMTQKEISESLVDLKKRGDARWAQVDIQVGALPGLDTVKVSRAGREMVWNNSNNKEQLTIKINNEVSEAAEIKGAATKPVKDTVPTVVIGSYPYRTDRGAIDLKSEWLGNDELLEVLGEKPEEVAAIMEDADIEKMADVANRAQYRYNMIKDPPSRFVNSPLVSKAPSNVAISKATQYLEQSKYAQNASQVDKLTYLHHLAVLSRSSAVGTDRSYKQVKADRLLATKKLREAAVQEPVGGVYAKIIEDLVWGSSVLMVQAQEAPAAFDKPELESKVNNKEVFTLDKPEDFDDVGRVFESMMKSGKIRPNIIISIKNFAPDNYLAYLNAVEAMSKKYNGSITFILSLEATGTLTHDYPGEATTLRRTADVLGADFFKNEHVATISDGGSKTRGGNTTQTQHGQFSLASMAHKMHLDGRSVIEVTNFLNMNLLTVGVAWLQMKNNYGQNVMLWPASDGVIKFGANPGFGNKSLAELPKRFMTATGGGVEIFSPADAEAIKKFAQEKKMAVRELVEPDKEKAVKYLRERLGKVERKDEDALSSARSDFKSKFGAPKEAETIIGKANAVYAREDLKLGDKGNFISNSETGELIQFAEKPSLAELAGLAAEKGGGKVTMNIFFLMADMQTALDIFVTEAFTKKDPATGEWLGQKIVSVFDKILGGLTTDSLKTAKEKKGTSGHALTDMAIDYVTKDEVRLLGVNYGTGYHIGDIGNLDLNAQMFQTLVKDSDIKFSDRVQDLKVVNSATKLPANINLTIEGKAIGSLSAEEKEKALILLKNVRVEVDDDAVSYPLNLREGSGIINSVIRFSQSGLKALDVTKGTVIIDSEIAGPMVIRGDNAILEGVSHAPDRFMTMDYSVDQDTGIVTSSLAPTTILNIYGDETTVTIFMRQPDGSSHNTVVRAWNLDYKAPIGVVSKSKFRLNQGVPAGLSEEAPEMFRQLQAFKKMAARHPMLLDVKDVSTWSDLLVKGKDGLPKIDPKTDAPLTLTLYELKKYSGLDFEKSKAHISAVIQRDQITRVRNNDDLAMKNQQLIDRAVNGGITLDASMLNMQVERTGSKVNIQVDPKDVKAIREGGVIGFRPVIINIQPVSGMLPALSAGVAADVKKVS